MLSVCNRRLTERENKSCIKVNFIAKGIVLFVRKKNRVNCDIKTRENCHIKTICMRRTQKVICTDNWYKGFWKPWVFYLLCMVFKIYASCKTTPNLSSLTPNLQLSKKKIMQGLKPKRYSLFRLNLLLNHN